MCNIGASSQSKHIFRLCQMAPDSIPDQTDSPHRSHQLKPKWLRASCFCWYNVRSHGDWSRMRQLAAQCNLILRYTHTHRHRTTHTDTNTLINLSALQNFSRLTHMHENPLDITASTSLPSCYNIFSRVSDT